MSLSTILRRGVGLQLEVMTEPAAGALAETLVAFANGDGGTVLLGARPDGQVTATCRSRTPKPSLAPEHRCSVARLFPRADWETFEDRAGWAVAIHVPRSTELHSLADGHVLVRTHQGNEPLDGGKIKHLAATKASGDYEMESVGAATRADPDDEVLQDFIQRRIAHLGRDLGQPGDESLARHRRGRTPRDSSP